MNKQQLDAWIADEKNAGSQYLQIAEEIRNSRFADASSGNSPLAKEQEEKVKEALDRQAALYSQQQIELKERYLSGKDEQLNSERAFHEEMQVLALQDLHARLAIFGLELEERKKLEQQLLDIRIKAMEDFNARKIEQDSHDKEERLAKNQQAMEENDEWMHSEMARLQQEHQQRTEIISQSLQEQVEVYKGYGAQIGNSLGQVLSGQEDMLSAFGNTMIDILFDVLSQIINQKIAEATAVAVAEQAKAAAISAAQPDSVITFGASAAARTAVIGGLIMAALTAAKSALKGLLTKGGKKSVGSSSSSGSSNNYTRVPGKAEGGYIDVTRQQDGKPFHAAYRPSARGFINRPTVIVGEGPAGMSREWVASNAAVMNPTVAPILSVIDQAQQAGTIRTLDLSRYLSAVTLRGKAEGGSVAPQASMPVPSADTEQLNRTMQALYALLNTIQRDGVHAYTLLSEVNKAQELQNRSRKIGSK